jgi:hypothetical protein
MVAEKPDRASEYSSEQAELVRATCLYVATKLGDLMDELPGLKVAFQDRRQVRIDGKTIFGENASREVWVCGPGAFVGNPCSIKP